MAGKIFGGMAGKAEGKLRGRQSQVENAVDQAVGSTAHEMISTSPVGTKIHSQQGGQNYSFKTTDKMQQRSSNKAASKAMQDWIDSGR